MPRKPVTVEMVGGKTPRQRVWEAIRRQHGQPFELSEVTPGDMPIASSRSYIMGLARAGILADAEPASAKKRWTLARDHGLEAPRIDKHGATVTQGSGTEAMWRTMRIIKEFTAASLAALSSTETARVRENTAQSYCKALERAGYLMISSPAKNSGGKARYRFISARYTGPRAPMIQSVKTVFDPNTCKIVWQPGALEILAEAERHGLV